jgi:HSP20 family molecular chaperone IbpA
MNEPMQRMDGEGNGRPMAELIVPAADICETNDAVHVKMDVPGLKPEELRTSSARAEAKVCSLWTSSAR